MTHFFILTFLGRLSDRPHSSGDRYRINRIGEKWTDTVWKVSHNVICLQGQSRSWLYGHWIYNYLCNQCLSPLILWVWISIRAKCTTLCDKDCQWLATGWWFSPVSSTNKADCHDITEILLKVMVNTIKQTNYVPSIHSAFMLNLYMLTDSTLYLIFLMMKQLSIKMYVHWFVVDKLSRTRPWNGTKIRILTWTVNITSFSYLHLLA